MSIAAVNKPDPREAFRDLKDFQRRTAEYAFKRLYLDEDSTHRFLVADEVGLGKTLIARCVIARAVEHLWDRVERVDIIYVCSNANIARQNINRLRLDKAHDFAQATRATLLPIELHGMAQRRVNFVSMTPGTSLEPSGGTGIAEERALLLKMICDHWALPLKPSLGVMRCGAQFDRFQAKLDNWPPEKKIAPELHKRFLADLDANVASDQTAGRPNIKDRFLALCESLPRKDSRLSDDELKERRRLVGQLRTILGRACIRALSPDLVILDEFQRFKHLLDPENDDAELARSLFEYADEREGNRESARVLLLSATPYKMYTLQHEQESGDNDHYADFIATYDFLVRHQINDVEALRRLLKDYRTAMTKLGNGSFEELRRLKGELEVRLRRVMARTERLAVTEDRSGMLKETPSPGMHLTESDVRQYLSTSRVAKALDQGDVVEYWKSAPYLLNFMDEYKIKEALRAEAGQRAAPELLDALAFARSSLLCYADIQAYAKIDHANARLRSLISDTVGQGFWRCLWLPPSSPYYRLGGAFKDLDCIKATKRLVFSSWKVVPKVIAALLSYEAERQAIGLSYQRPDGTITIENSTDGRKTIAALLRFGRADGRLTGMPVLGLVYPSVFLAQELDPAAISTGDAGLSSAAELLDYVCDCLQPHVDKIVAIFSRGSDVDEAWYWAAPILLDAVSDRRSFNEFWQQKDLARLWSGAEDQAEADENSDDDSVWAEHVKQARNMADGALSFIARKLGKPPPDLVKVIANAAFGNPAVLALRSLARVAAMGNVADVDVRLAAGRVAWKIRNLFNLPEVNSLIRGPDSDEPYWQRVVKYCIDGCLQSVLDEYAHVLRDSLGVGSQNGSSAADQIGREMVSALSLRSASVGVDEVIVNAELRNLRIEPRRMRTRFAARFGQDQIEADGEVTRADSVRAAFNSPFWPFVLASTSVGQEGLDFHHYCHAVVHWNLPSNPVDLEQREGRVHRFKGHAIRKNVALRHWARLCDPLKDPWEGAFERALADRTKETSELIPFWVYPHVSGASIQRYVPTLPLSRDADRLIGLRSTLAVYRMVFGQPRQDELVSYLLTRLPREVVDTCVRELRIDLEPPISGSESQLAL